MARYTKPDSRGHSGHGEVEGSQKKSGHQEMVSNLCQGPDVLRSPRREEASWRMTPPPPSGGAFRGWISAESQRQEDVPPQPTGHASPVGTEQEKKGWVEATSCGRLCEPRAAPVGPQDINEGRPLQKGWFSAQQIEASRVTKRGCGVSVTPL